MIDDDIAAMSLEEHIEERVNAAILAERQRCADVVEDYCSDMPDLAGHGHSIGLKDAILAGEAA